MKKIHRLLVIISFCCCVPYPVDSAVPEELKIHEQEFSKKTYQESLNYLRQEFPKILRESKDRERVIQSSEGSVN